jgi:hypothetical protein
VQRILVLRGPDHTRTLRRSRRACQRRPAARSGQAPQPPGGSGSSMKLPPKVQATGLIMLRMCWVALRKLEMA